MTVVVGMRFSPRTGLLLADEQTSYGARKSDFADKIYVQNGEELPYLIAAGAGAADIIYKALIRYDARADHGVQPFHEAVQETKRIVVDEYLFSKYGLSTAAFHSGVDPAGRPLAANVSSRLENIFDSHGGEINQLLSNDFVLLEPHDMSFWRTSMMLPTLIPIPRPYVTVGTGLDGADAYLSRFYDDVSREDRMNIGFAQGLRAALAATDESARKNLGVGGVPSLAIVRDGRFLKPSQRSTRLAMEIVRAANKGIVDEGFVDDGLEQLVEKPESFERTNRAFVKAAKSRSALDMFLRGYIE